MDYVRVQYLKDQIAQLPKGNITYKTINGKNMPISSGRKIKNSTADECHQ